VSQGRLHKPKNLLMIVMLSPYLILLALFGVLPLIMAVINVPSKSPANPNGGWHVFKIVLHDFRLVPAMWHVLGFMAIFVPLMIIFVVAMSLMLDANSAPWKKYVRLAYIVPACVSGSVAVLLWYVLLEPTLSPFKGFMHWMGVTQAIQIWRTSNLTFILAFMAFFALAGQWILIQFGSLQSISTEVLEAARVDGCSQYQLAMKIKLPLIRKYVIYMGVLVFAGGLQIFVEPQLLNSSVYHGIANQWSFDQLSYSLAFDNGNFGEASALSLMLLIPSLIGALLVIFKTDMFEDVTLKSTRKLKKEALAREAAQI
jgi:multiple sugar transport system permease protein